MCNLRTRVKFLNNAITLVLSNGHHAWHHSLSKLSAVYKRFCRSTIKNGFRRMKYLVLNNGHSSSDRLGMYSGITRKGVVASNINHTNLNTLNGNNN